MKKTLALVAVFVAATFSVFAQVSFSNVSVNENDDVLFAVTQSVPGTADYSSLLKMHLGKKGAEGNYELLTCFPEKLEMIKNGGVLQIRNRYGSAWYSVAERKLSWVTTSAELPVEYSRLSPQNVSPDGMYSCFVRQSKNGMGQLVLLSLQTQEQVIVAESVDFNFESVSASWSKDSAFLLYEKNGELFFINPSSAFSKVQLSESFRKIGSGKISSAKWTEEKSLLYIDGDIVYRILQNELYTRGLYASLAGVGKIVGRLPHSFDPAKDSFWTNYDGTQIVVVSQNNLVSYYSLASQNYDFVKSNGLYSLTGERGAILGCEIFWNSKKEPLLWVDMLLYEDGKRSSRLYALDSSLKVLFDVKDSVSPVASPDGSMLAFTAGESIYVFDINTASVAGRLKGEPVVSFAWGSSSTLYVGGMATVRSWNIRNNTSSVLFLSSVKSAWWSGSLIYASESYDEGYFSYSSLSRTWVKVGDKAPLVKLSDKNSRYRVFVGAAQNRQFENAVFVRSLSGSVVTYPLFVQTDVPVQEKKRVALVFDAVDRSDGLPLVLSALSEFKVPATFFINGEFIRRYPSETNQIVASGYECASGFFSTMDLTDSVFVIDEDFVQRGLARNEDEFYATTQRELALLWHSPFYRINSSILSAGEGAGYRYVDALGSELSLPEIIEKVVPFAYDGMVIPINVGWDTQKITLLISSLLDSGCTIVDVRDFLD